MSRREQNIKLVTEFEQEHSRSPFDLHEVYDWAKANGKWSAPKDFEAKKFVEEVGQALREEHFIADDGEPIRTYHANLRIVNGRQQWLWAHWEYLTREFFEEGVQLRRKQGYDVVKQINRDVNYLNRTRFADNPVQLSFNYDIDLAEDEALKNTKRKGKGA